MSSTIRDFKSFTSKEITRTIKKADESRKEWILGQMKYYADKHKRNKDYQLWTHENHAISLETNKFKDQKLEYIHQNPVRVGIVEQAEHYLYSSARDYSGVNGLVPIEFIE